MSFDLALDPGTRDLRSGFVTGSDEVVQRLVTRLKRELGEWFLNRKAGLPWYQEGKGMLGAKAHNRRTIELLIRREALGTDGVERIVKMNTLFPGRTFSIYLEVYVRGVGVTPVTVEGGE